MAAAEALDPTPDPLATRPTGLWEWVQSELREHMWSKQRQIAESVQQNRYTAVPSCHSAGKSYTASRIMAAWNAVHPQGEAFIVSTAPTTHQVKAILWRELSRAHRKAHLPGYITLDAQWRAANGELIGYGRKPADYNPDAFQGIHQRYILIVIDEANGVPETIFNAIDSVASNVNARVLAIGNPDSPNSHFYTICKPGSGWNVIRISAFDTPNFTGEYVPQRLKEDLVSPTWVEERKARWGETSPMYQSKVLAMFPDITEDYLIQPKWLQEAQERVITAQEATANENDRCLGVDVARYGTDHSVVYLREGGRVRRVHRSHQQSTAVTAGHVARIAREMDKDAADPTPINVDVVGLGAGVVDMLTSFDFNVTGVHAQARPDEPERFANARSEWYWHVREAFERGDYDIDPKDEQLAAELGNLKWSVTPAGKIKVESKEDYRDRTGAPSPDCADAFCYATISPALELPADAHTAIHTGTDTITGDLLTRNLG